MGDLILVKEGVEGRGVGHRPIRIPFVLTSVLVVKVTVLNIKLKIAF